MVTVLGLVTNETVILLHLWNIYSTNIVLLNIISLLTEKKKYPEVYSVILAMLSLSFTWELYETEDTHIIKSFITTVTVFT